MVLFPQKPCNHQTPKRPQKFKQEFWQILYLRDQGTLQRNCSRWTFVRQQSRERKQKERWSTEGLIHTFQSFFLFVLFSSFDRLVSIVWLCWCSVCLLTVRNLKFECCNIYLLEGYQAFGQVSSILFSTIFLSHFIHLALLSSFWLGSDSLLLLSCALCLILSKWKMFGQQPRWLTSLQLVTKAKFYFGHQPLFLIIVIAPLLRHMWLSFDVELCKWIILKLKCLNI